MSKSILELSSAEALDHFCKSEQYHNYELPEYFNFDKILVFVRNKIGEANFDEIAASDPCEIGDLNMDLLLNSMIFVHCQLNQ
ncbi:hypothetical protein EEL33_19390 [Muribaculaceae bacterium Isolate-037 (Harlan)]|jgi:hypothetical protein|nr:hypothetical protein EEL33_19390 [Muribaculaceae bacterium Isolate-037 (Harlan)]